MNGPSSLPAHTVGEWSLRSERAYQSPFADVEVDGVLTSPSGASVTMPAFHDGDGTWRLRFNPKEAGDWHLRVRSRPHDPELSGEARFSVAPRTARGTLRATPGDAWGYRFEDGTPFLAIGDTTYDLFGMDLCGGDVPGFLARRRSQGFNLFRVRLPLSRFHPPEGDFAWQDRDMWAWGGSRSMPRFDRFDLAWFRHVDGCVRRMEEMGLGMELIMEGWGFEFPFNHRTVFTPEWEQLWMRWLIARYDAFDSVYFWTPLNEYEYYPNGDWHWKAAADRWLIRVGRWIKDTAPHGHLVTLHNGPVLPPFAERLRADPEAIDSVAFQAWGARDRDNAWLATGIEDTIAEAFAGWTGSRIFAEWGYERNPAYENKLPHHEFCDRSHTRRAAWRGVTQGMGIINGQEPSWGPWMELDLDLPGTADIVVLRDFLTDAVPFHGLRPAPDLVSGAFAPGHRPLALRSVAGDAAVVYFPAGGEAAVAFDAARAQWFDPREATWAEAAPSAGRWAAPSGTDEAGHPLDAVLVLRA